MKLDTIVTRLQHDRVPAQTLTFNALALCAEAGELANVVKKLKWYSLQTEGNEELRIIDEMCDVLFHLYALCKDMDMTIEELTAIAEAKYEPQVV